MFLALPISNLLPKLFEVFSFMARWGRSFFHKSREKIREHKVNIDRLVNLYDDRSVKDYLDSRGKGEAEYSLTAGGDLPETTS